MPILEQKEMRALDIEQLRTVLKACHSIRDKAVITFFVDTSVRRKELCALNVSDVDMDSGFVKLRETKGRKF
jgi:integrase